MRNFTPNAAGGAVHVDLDAIVANWRLLCARHPGGPVAGVVKGDGYGLGAGPVASALYATGCRHFFVALLDEALAIRDLVPDAMLAVLGGLIPGSESEYVARGIVPVLGSLAEIDAWGKAVLNNVMAGVGLSAILHIDTGMSRLGLDARELAILQQDHARLRAIDLRYIMTHLVSAEAGHDPLNHAQRRRFAEACALLPKAPTSIANSSGIFLGEDFGSDLARPGAALYGINPTPGQPNPMRPVVRLMGRVLAVRDIPKGATAGYNATWAASRPSRIATVGVGYADGWHRVLSNNTHAFFDGTPVPLVGRVSMDLTTFDITDHPAIGPGAWLELLGPHQTPDDIAAAAGTNGYEILTSLALRLPRVYQKA
jgi:alanine racemase